MSKLPCITAQFLWRNLRYAVFSFALASCFVAPTPHAPVLLLFMTPMLLLYFAAMATFTVMARLRAH
jgi:Sec-independent protein secretion pathway component TatC